MKQRIELELDVPDGWEATGEIRPLRTGDNGLAWSVAAQRFVTANLENSPYEPGRPCIILRRIEPDEVKLAKEFKAFFSGKGGFDVAELQTLTGICDRIIAKHEAKK